MNGREQDGDGGVIGWGNWAELANGTIIGSGTYHGLYLGAGRAKRA